MGPREKQTPGNQLTKIMTMPVAVLDLDLVLRMSRPESLVPRDPGFKFKFRGNKTLVLMNPPIPVFP